MWYLTRWTSNGRDFAAIWPNPGMGPTVACGSRQAMEAASRLLFGPDWEAQQFWRAEHYRLTGKMLW